MSGHLDESLRSCRIALEEGGENGTSQVLLSLGPVPLTWLPLGATVRVARHTFWHLQV